MAWKTKKSDYEQGKVLYTEKKVQGSDLILYPEKGEHPLLGLRLFGKSTQVTTTGAQLLNYDAWEGIEIQNGDAVFENNGITLTAAKDDCYTKYSEDYFPENARIPLTSGQTITISWEESDNKSGSVYIFNNGSADYKEQVNNNDSKSISFTAIEGTEFVTFRFGVSNEGNTISYKNIMINIGDTPLPYEPFTGGKLSPSLDYPQEIESVGDDGSVVVSIDEQSLTLQTPNGLPGIPVGVDELANYTDSDGVKWCCDEVDLERGVYVQRVGKYMYTGEESFGDNSTWDKNAPDVLHRSVVISDRLTGNENSFMMCNAFPSYISTYQNHIKNECTYAHYSNTALFLFIAKERLDTADDDGLRKYLKERYDSGQAIVVHYILADPIETPLSEEELAAYQSLSSNYPITTVLNDANAWTEIAYPTNIMYKPKTDWKWISNEEGDYFNLEDYNRIIGNIEYLRELSAKVNPEFDTEHLDEKLSYSDYIYADEFNTIEENLTKICKGTFPYTTEQQKTYYPNQPTPDYTELNRIESLLLERYRLLQGQINGRKTLSFRLGGGEF